MGADRHPIIFTQAPKQTFCFCKEIVMKGYNTPDGYMGFVEGRYILFSCERDYLEYTQGTM